MGLQHQRIALGTVNIGGREHPVYITIPWLKVLESLSGSVTTIVDGGGGSGGAAGLAIDLPNDDASTVKVLAIGLQRAVSALEADAELSALRAKVAALEARIAGLEQAP